MSENKPFLPYGRQSLNEADIQAVVDVLRSDWITQGPQVEAFERALAEKCNARFAVVCANGTAALHLAYSALGVGDGDTVVTSPVTFLATANAARMCGAEIEFVDVEKGTVNLSPKALERFLEQKGHASVKVVTPIHFAGHPADMLAIHALAERYEFAVIEDAAHALGARYRNPESKDEIVVGSCAYSDMTIFSFHPVKHITTGEGGAITTNDEHLYRKLLLLRNHGMQKDSFVNTGLAADRNGKVNPWYYEMSELGYNYRITDMQCALGIQQINRLDDFVTRRRSIATEYREQIEQRLNGLVLPLLERDEVRHAYHLFPVTIEYEAIGLDRAEVMLGLRQRGIGSQVHYIPLHYQPYYRSRCKVQPGTLKRAESYYTRCLSLPMFPDMPIDGVNRVVDALCEILGPNIKQAGKAPTID
jgi:UDP-4-amino-4,6-dideoxy-N-acetyl-beta-L-altrosamine transaminase